MKQRVYFLLGIFCSLLFTKVNAQKQESSLPAAIQKIVKEQDMKHASIGICVIDVTSNKVVAAHQPDQSLIPASTMKIITTSTALAILGGNYKFKTELQHDGVIENGILKGNLYIKGYGDPTLGSDQMEGVGGLMPLVEALGNAIKRKGIKQIDGKIIGDGTYFESNVNSESWAWNDIGNYYGAGASGLNIHENMYHLTFLLGANLDKAPELKRVEPEIPNLYFINELTSDTKYSGDNAYIYGAPRTYERYIRGTLPIGTKEFTIKGSIPDPAYFLAYRLHKYLREKLALKTTGLTSTQLEFNRQGNSPEGNKRTLIYTHESPPLNKIVDRANKKSVNLYCESLLKTIGTHKYAKGNTASGIKAVQEFWKQRGINIEGWFMEDGSGLSPRNGISAKKLSTIMAKIIKDNKTFPDFRALMTNAKQRGILKDSDVWLKSGSMGRVRAYTGVVKTKSGRQLSFTMIANNYMGKGSSMQIKWRKLISLISNEL